MKSAYGNTAARSGSDIIARVASLIIAAAAIFLFSLASAGKASADYVCQCVNGELAAIVSGNIDVQPVAAGVRAAGVPGTDIDVVDGAEPAGVVERRQRLGLRAAAGDEYGDGAVRVEGALQVAIGRR